MIKIKFPHILREKTAPFLGILGFSLRWGLLLLFVALNVSKGSSILLNVLGASTTGSQEVEKHAQAALDLSYWQNVAEMHPDYKDAYVKIASAAWELHEDEVAKTAVLHALTLSPNDQTAQELYSFFSSAGGGV